MHDILNYTTNTKLRHNATHYFHKSTDSIMICLEQSYQKALLVDPSYKAAAECLAIVLTDIGTNIKLAGNTQEGIQKYFEALKIDPHYAVILPHFLHLTFIVKYFKFI